MGADQSIPDSPEELWEWYAHLHARGKIRAVESLFKRTRRVMETGGILMLQIVGRLGVGIEEGTHRAGGAAWDTVPDGEADVVIETIGVPVAPDVIYTELPSPTRPMPPASQRNRRSVRLIQEGDQPAPRAVIDLGDATDTHSCGSDTPSPPPAPPVADGGRAKDERVERMERLRSMFMDKLERAGGNVAPGDPAALAVRTPNDSPTDNESPWLAVHATSKFRSIHAFNSMPKLKTSSQKRLEVFHDKVAKARKKQAVENEDVKMLPATSVWLPPQRRHKQSLFGMTDMSPAASPSNKQVASDPPASALRHGSVSAPPKPAKKTPGPIPQSIERLSQHCCACAHVECKLSFLHLSLAAGQTGSGLRKDYENRVEMSGPTLRVTIAALSRGKEMKRSQLVHLCDVIKMYSTTTVFRRGFITFKGVEKLVELVVAAVAKKQGVELVTALLGTLRSVLTLECSKSGPRASFWEHALHTTSVCIANTLVSTVYVRDKDCTFLVEQMALSTLVIMMRPTHAVSMTRMATEAHYFLSGRHSYYVSPQASLFLTQTLSFILKSTDVPELSAAQLVNTMRVLVVQQGFYSHILFYAVLVLEVAVDRLFADPAFGTKEATDEDSLTSLECLTSMLMRSTTGMWGAVSDALCCVTAKLLSIAVRYTDRPRHCGLLRSHAVCHVIVATVLRSPDIPTNCHVPAMQILARICDQEKFSQTLHHVWGPKVGTPRMLDVKSCIAPACRLLSVWTTAPAVLLARLPIAEAIFVFIHACLDNYPEVARMLFSAMSVSEFWVWQYLPTHLTKAARAVDKTNAKEAAKVARPGERELRKLFAAMAHTQTPEEDIYATWLAAHQKRMAVQYARDHNEFYTGTVGAGLVYPDNVTWEVLGDPKEAEGVADRVQRVAASALQLAERLYKEEFFSKHMAKYTECARKVQRWFRQRWAIRQIARSAEESKLLHEKALMVQRLFRGWRCRRRLEETIVLGRMRRAAALLIQFYFRLYRRQHQKHVEVMTRFICEKCRIPMRAQVTPDPVVPGQSVRSYVVRLDEWNYFNRVLNSNQNARSYTLVYFYHPRVAPSVMHAVEQLAITFRDYTELTIAAVNGDENRNLMTSLKIPGYPWLVWVDKNNMTHDYTPSWPPRPLSLKSPVLAYSATRIQQFWRRRRIARATAAVVEMMMQKHNWQRRVDLRKCCYSGDRAALDKLIRKVPADIKVDTDELPCNIALKAGQRHVFAELVKAGVNLNLPDLKGHTPIFYAVALGLTGVVRMMVNKGADLTLVDIHGRTLFHIACECRQESIALLILNLTEGRDDLAGRRDKNGYTALDYAMSNGLETISLKFLRMAIPIHEDIQRGFLFHCMLKNMIDIANLLIASGLTDLNESDGTDKQWRPVHYAACMGLVPCLERLIHKGTDLRAKTAANQTALHLAAKKGHVKCVLLLAKEMHLDAEELVGMAPIPGGTKFGDLPADALGEWVDVYGNTVLHYCCMHVDLQAFTEKLIREVDSTTIPGQNYAGNTPLHLAAEAGNYFVAYHLSRKTLLLGGLDTLNNNGNTALHLSLLHGHIHLSKMLFELGSDIFITDGDGNSSLQIAMASKHMSDDEKKDVSVFLQKEAQMPLGWDNNSGQTVLHLLAALGLFDALQVLVENLKNPKSRKKLLNYADHEGNTCLHFACKRGHIEKERSCKNYPYNNPMIIFLITEGADPRVQNRLGYTPEDLAVSEQVVKRAMELRKVREEEETFENLTAL